MMVIYNLAMARGRLKNNALTSIREWLLGNTYIKMDDKKLFVDETGVKLENNKKRVIKISL
jgi:hypothetical protein